MKRNITWDYCFPATIYAIMLIGMMVMIPYSVFHGLNESYESYGISDWMINYQGGFVRRGFIGELLLAFCSFCPVSPKVVITIIGISAFIFFVYKIWKASEYLRMSLFPLLTLFLSVHKPIIWYRRDYMMMVMAFYIFYYVTQYISTRRTSRLLLVQALSVLAIIIQESTFFFTIPLAFTVTALVTIRGGIRKMCATCMKLFFPSILAMGVVCLMKGDSGISQAIWHSWANILERYPDDSLPAIGHGVGFLRMEPHEAMIMHLETNFQYKEGFPYILWSAVSLAVTILASYFLLAMNPHVDYKNKRLSRQHDGRSLGRILLFQHLAMMPMYTVLSCDYARTIMYSAMSAIFMLYAIRKNGIHISEIEAVNTYTPDVLYARRPLLYSYTAYILLVLFFPLRSFGSINIPFHSLFFSF